MAGATPAAEMLRGGRVRIYTGGASVTVTVEKALSILRSRRRLRDPTAAALAQTIAQSRVRA